MENQLWLCRDGEEWNKLIGKKEHLLVPSSLTYLSITLPTTIENSNEENGKFFLIENVNLKNHKNDNISLIPFLFLLLTQVHFNNYIRNWLLFFYPPPQLSPFIGTNHQHARNTNVLHWNFEIWCSREWNNKLSLSRCRKTPSTTNEIF